MAKRPLLPGRSTEAEFLSQVGFWFVNSKEARDHAPRIRKLRAQGFIGMRRHRRDDGEITDAYELSDSGLARLEQVAGAEAAELARSHRKYLQDLALKQRVR